MRKSQVRRKTLFQHRHHQGQPQPGWPFLFHERRSSCHTLSPSRPRSTIRPPYPLPARLSLPIPKQGTAKLFSGEATGLLVQLPGWEYPAVIDTLTGSISYDNFEGSWGDQQHLSKFLQMYAVEKAKLEARKKGLPGQRTNSP